MDALKYMRLCPRCENYKSSKEFGSKYNVKSAWCLQCHSEYNKEWYKDNKEKHCSNTAERYESNKEERLKKITAWKRKKETGCTQEMYNEMFVQQGGYCSICGRHQSEMKRQLSVDHCHRTGKIRGLLCNLCNTALGKFKDNTIFLQRAIAYLEKHRNV